MNRSLLSYLKDLKVIATMGTCKNAGKTTVLNYLIDCYRQRFPLGITSIGLDGEEKDAVTKLPKPRVMVYPGMLVATTIECLDKSDITFRIKKDPQMYTPMGKVFIIEVLTPGILEIAGPVMMTEQKQVAEEMLSFGAKKVILDGAAGRMAFANLADGSILSVGAALSNQMDEVVKQAEYQVELLTLPAVKDILAKELMQITDTLATPYIDIDEYHRLYRGVLDEQDVVTLMKDYQMEKKKLPTLVVKDSMALFVKRNTYRKFLSLGGQIRVLKPVTLTALTINPMTPYGEWFDPNEFMKAMKEKLDLPVYNIKNEKVNYDDE